MHRPRRRFGQNFLTDAGILERMADTISPAPGEAVLEIGPGRGALTAPLLDRGAQVTAIEIDRDLAATLQQWPATQDGRLTVIEDDALAQPVANFRPAGAGPLRIVGNLPYNLSTPLLFHLTDDRDSVSDLHLLLQREVVERMAAEPGSRVYGRLSVMLQYRCQVDPLFDLPPTCFTPAPRVTSAFVRLRPHPTPPIPPVNERCLADIVAQAFGQRRKTLRNALASLLDAAAIEAAGVNPGDRAERIDLAGFGRLARVLAQSQTPPEA
ncbi:MAG: 16S rRNA (adenine(1518)-N(6)/adenine(1519)-N(6))-dimethyltransferase RsmA [Spiribacter sp.]|nr:16S rRNA (adenine(1518)-N(6)/adenine(1519)-N(6))-dimethyltransferase RsmA [Spiribacter sp.]